MGIYSHLTDEELVAKRAELLEIYEQISMGAAVTKVSGEGRLMEYTRGNAGAIRDLMRDVEREQNGRSGDDTDGAIRVIW